jgi:hypothetical protein
MALQLGALREALIDAGASPEKANKAAEEVASHFAWRARIANPCANPWARWSVGMLVAYVAALVAMYFFVGHLK